MDLAIRWLAKNHYSRVRYRAKKMGATYIDLTHFRHRVKFEYTTVTFAFGPFECYANISANDAYKGAFCDEESANKIKKDIDVALEFMTFLHKFNDELKEEWKEKGEEYANNTKES